MKTHSKIFNIWNAEILLGPFIWHCICFPTFYCHFKMYIVLFWNYLRRKYETEVQELKKKQGSTKVETRLNWIWKRCKEEVKRAIPNGRSWRVKKNKKGGNQRGRNEEKKTWADRKWPQSHRMEPSKSSNQIDSMMERWKERIDMSEREEKGDEEKKEGGKFCEAVRTIEWKRTGRREMKETCQYSVSPIKEWRIVFGFCCFLFLTCN